MTLLFVKYLYLLYPSFETQEKKIVSVLASAPTLDGAASAHRPAWERALRACPTSVPADPLSSPFKIHDIIFNDVMKCTYLRDPAPASTQLAHRKTRSMWLNVARLVRVPCRYALGCLLAPHQKPCPCGADVGHHAANPLRRCSFVLTFRWRKNDPC